MNAYTINFGDYSNIISNKKTTGSIRSVRLSPAQVHYGLMRAWNGMYLGPDLGLAEGDLACVIRQLISEHSNGAEQWSTLFNNFVSGKYSLVVEDLYHIYNIARMNALLNSTPLESLSMGMIVEMSTIVIDECPE